MESSAALVRGLLARCTFPAGGPVVCAVSGGADSTALLALAVHAGLDTTAIHVDHGLRSGSEDEAGVVVETAHRLGARFESRRVVVEPGPNLEARARAARYSVLPFGVLTGHTADDQAETMLLNLVRGAALRGLAGMADGPHPRRPILALRRSETRALVDSLGLATVEDPSNLDPRHRRNRVRHEVMPLLDAVAERDVAPVLARQAASLRADDDLLEALAAELDPTDSRALAAAPAPLAERAVRSWLAPVLGGYPPERAAVERVLAVARCEVAACELPGGARVERRARRLIVVPPTRPASAE